MECKFISINNIIPIYIVGTESREKENKYASVPNDAEGCSGSAETEENCQC